jgi:hypothetical protein
VVAPVGGNRPVPDSGELHQKAGGSGNFRVPYDSTYNFYANAMTNQLWLAVLSSSLLSGIFGAFIAGVFGLRGKQNEYVNDYFKIIIKRRLDSYEKLEQLINALKLAVLDEDQKLYHQVFSSEGTWAEIYHVFLESTSHPLWLSDHVFAKTRELNIMFLQASSNEITLVEFGKSKYVVIAELREEIERLHAKDMRTLHDVEGFLKRKKVNKSGFVPIDIRAS